MSSLIFRCFCILETLLLTRAFFNEHSLKSFPKPSFGTKNDSLYGFSIAYQPKSSRLFVGAPQASHAGQIYYINMNTGKMTKEPWETQFAKQFKVTDKDIEDDYWLGTTVATGPDFYVTCLPKFIDYQKPSNDSKDKVPASLSFCYIKQNEKIYRLEPLNVADRSKNTTVFRDRMDSFGWSIHVVSNQKDILIGGAAMFTGRVSLYNVLKKDSHPKLIHQVSADNPVKFSFGYSVTSGKFFSDQIVYAISTTYGDKGYGKVYFFNTNLDNIGSIIDDHVSSMFGAALCSAMIRGPALLVGAPTYTDNGHSYDVGAVYIYTAQSIGSNRMTMRRMIQGSQNGGYFGHSIVSLGDLDDDGNDEIAIAAPYEDDGRGAVYIYSGVGIFEGTVRKRIQPEGLHAFGFSLASLQRETGSNGLAVGAIWDNSSVVIFDSIASITVNLTGSVNIVKEDKTRRELEIIPCVNVEYPKKPVEIMADLTITIKVSEQLCTINEGNDTHYTYNVTIRERITPLCRYNVTASCLNVTDSNVILSYEITATSEGDPENTVKYEPSRVLLSERSSLSYRATEYTLCDEKICKPVLEVHVSSTFPLYYIVGSSKSEKFSVNVTNSGDTAYGACVELHVRGAVVSHFPPDCTMRAGTDTIICKHSIRKDQLWGLSDFKLEPPQGMMSTQENYVGINGVLYNDCNKQNQSGVPVNKRLTNLIGDTNNINITGQANPEGDVDVTPDDLRTERKSFEHLYRIENKGITDWNGMQVRITLPYLPYIGYPEVPIKIYPDASYRACPMDNRTGDNNVIIVTCNIGDLPKLQTTLLTISIEIVPNTLELDEKKPNVTVATTIELLGTNKSLSEQSLVKLYVVSVPTWVIATASIIGLLLFALIVFCLYEFGFLKRKNKDKLVALKKEVYRQSMRRSQIRDSMRAVARRKSTEDIQFLTDAAGDIGEREMTIDERLQKC